MSTTARRSLAFADQSHEEAEETFNVIETVHAHNAHKTPHLK